MKLVAIQDAKPGDAVFARTRGVYGFLIRLAQSLRWRPWSSWNHMAMVVSNDGQGNVEVIQMARRCEKVRIEDVAPGGRLAVVSCPADVDAARAVAYGYKQLGTKYGVLTILCIALNLYTPRFLRVDFRRVHTLICSAFVARCWEHGGWDCPEDPFQINPAEFYEAMALNG